MAEVITRRGFLAAGAVGAALVGTGGVGALTRQADAAYVRPPGATSNAELVAACNRCQKCLQACPYGIITPVPLAENIIAYGTPTVAFEHAFCDFCMKCVDACPTGALAYGGPRERDMGVAVVLKDACVAMVPIQDSTWYLVVKVNASVTADQVSSLMARSLLFFGLLALLLAGILFAIFRAVRDARVARESEKAKSTFLANMSHEIRTPLNGIVGLHYLMRQNLDDPAKLSEYLNQANVSSEYLKSVITDVLDMSKIESGQMELYAQPFDLEAMLSDIETLIDLQAKEYKLNFSIEREDITASYVEGDEMRIKQIIVNLLGNALKFTPEGGRVTLGVNQKVINGTAVTTFVVSDTGCGMSPDFLERIWEPFEQERRVASQNGTGLGTALSKVLVDKMEGTIEVESEQDKGTTFTVVLPLPVSHAEIASAAASSEGEETLVGKRVLVAEDNGVNRMIIVDILEDEGCIVTAASDGAEAVEAFAASEEGTFDVVLMDLQMPHMDGYQAAATIRALKRADSARVPIMALTANAFRDDVDRALKSGMNDVVTKPLDVRLLLDKLRACSSEAGLSGDGEEN